MKNAGKFLALGLSVCMLTGSVPAVVYAEECAAPVKVQAAEAADANAAVRGDEDGETSEYGGLIDHDTVYEGTMSYSPNISFRISGARELRTCVISGEGEWKGTGLIYSPDPAIMQYANIRNIVVSEGITNIPDCCFKLLEGIHRFTLPDGLLSIGSRAFQNSTRITELEIPDSVKTIGSHAFAYTHKLKKINLPKNLESIGDYAFYLADSLEEAEIPDTKVKLGRHLFQYAGIKKLTLPGVMENCPDDFFSYLENVQDLYFKGTKEEFYTWTAPYDVELAENCVLHFGENGEESEPYDPINYQKMGLEEMSGQNEDGETVYTCRQKLACNPDITWELRGSGDNLTLTFTGKGDLGQTAADFAGKKTPYYLGKADSIKKIKVGNGITGIGEGAFADFKNLESAELAEGVTAIGARAFENCPKLKICTILDGMKQIGAGAFADCTELADCLFPDSVEKIGEETFAGCERLKEFRVPASLKTVLGAEIFGEDTSWRRSIRKLYLPEGLKADNAFFRSVIYSVPTAEYAESFGEDDCKEKEIVYAGSEEAFYDDLKAAGIFTIARDTQLRFADGTASELDARKARFTKSGAVNDTVKWTVGGWDDDMTVEFTGSGSSEFTKKNLENLKKYLGSRVYAVSIGDGITDTACCRGLQSPADGSCGAAWKTLELGKDVQRISSAEDFRNVNEKTEIRFGSSKADLDALIMNSADVVVKLTEKSPLKVRCVTAQGSEIYAVSASDYEVNAGGICGENIKWEIAGTLCDMKLVISGDGRMDAYTCKYGTGAAAGNAPVFTPERPWEKYVPLVSEIVVEGKCDVGANAFRGCENVRKVSLGKDVKRIGANAFAGEKNLQSLVIPEGVTEIGTGAFCGNEKLEKAEFGNGALLTIGKNAFAGCALREVEIPDSVCTIGADAFASNPLEKAIVPDNLPFVGDGAFCSDTEIIRAESDGADRPAENVTGYGSCGDSATWQVSVETEDEKDEADTGKTEDAAAKDYKLLRISGSGELWNYQPQYTEKGKNSYAKTKSVREGGAVYEVAVPDGRPWANNVKKVQIDEGITGLGEYAFAGMNVIGEVKLPESIVRIDRGAFTNCKSLTKVEIGKNVQSIGRYAFYNCPNLTDIYYEGTKEAWEKLVEVPEEEEMYTYDKAAVKVHFAGETESGQKADETLHAHVCASNLSLREAIEVHTYLTLSDALAEDKGAFVILSREEENAGVAGSGGASAGREEKIALADLESITLGDRKAVVLDFDVDAKELHDRFVIRVVDGEGRSVALFGADGKECEKDALTVSAADCCTNTLAMPGLGGAQKKLLKALLNYGVSVQKLLGYKAENLADVKGAGSVKTSELKAYVQKTEGKLPAEICYAGANLEMKSKVEALFYFRAEDGAEDAYTFTCNGKKVIPERDKDTLIVRISGIRAVDLAKINVIEVKKNSGEDTEKTWSLSYSTYSYAYDVLRSGKTSKELKDAAKALCLYGRAAAVNFSKEEA